MTNRSIIEAVHAERQHYSHMMNVIADMAAIEKVSPRFASLICEFQKEMDMLFMESTNAYHEMLSSTKAEEIQ